MRYLTLIFALMALFPKWAKADGYKEPRTGIEFPEKVGVYQRGNTTPYHPEPDKDGVAVAYQAEDTEVTVYVRALGNEANKDSAYFLEDTLAVVKALEAQGKYSNVKIYAFSADKEKAGWKTAAFTSTSEHRFLVSFIYCTVLPGYLVKIRATTGNPKNESLQPFIKTLQDVVDRTSKKP